MASTKWKSGRERKSPLIAPITVPIGHQLLRRETLSTQLYVSRLHWSTKVGGIEDYVRRKTKMSLSQQSQLQFLWGEGASTDFAVYYEGRALAAGNLVPEILRIASEGHYARHSIMILFQ